MDVGLDKAKNDKFWAYYKFVKPTTNDLKRNEESVENLYGFVHKEQKAYKILYCKLSHRLNS